MLLRRNAKAVLGVVGFATFAVIVVLGAVGFAAFAVIVYDRGQSYNLFRRESLLAALSTLGGGSGLPYKTDEAFVYWGDSLTSGYGSGFGHDFPSLITFLYHRRSINLGKPGETSGQIRDRFLARAKPSGPEAVVIWAGRNNAYQPEEVERDIASMVSSLNPSSRYLVLGIVNADVENERQGGVSYARITELNTRLAKVYGPRYVPVREALLAAANRRFAEDVRCFDEDIVPASLRSDSLHLNDVGQAVVAESVQAAMVANRW
jgi:lysophospholipase L1-like esterase